MGSRRRDDQPVHQRHRQPQRDRHRHGDHQQRVHRQPERHLRPGQAAVRIEWPERRILRRSRRHRYQLHRQQRDRHVLRGSEQRDLHARLDHRHAAHSLPRLPDQPRSSDQPEERHLLEHRRGGLERSRVRFREGIAVQVRGYVGDSGSYTPYPATLSGLSITGSTITGNGGPGITLDNRETILDAIEINSNRIVGNGLLQGPGTPGGLDSNAPVNGIYAWATPGGGPAPFYPAVDAENNWFGCKTDPQLVPACTPNLGVPAVNSNVDSDPWLVLTADPTSPTLPLDGSVDIDALIDTNSGPSAPLATGPQVDYASDDTNVATVSPATDNLDPAGAVLDDGQRRRQRTGDDLNNGRQPDHRQHLHG